MLLVVQSLYEVRQGSIRAMASKTAKYDTRPNPIIVLASATGAFIPAVYAAAAVRVGWFALKG